MQSAISCVLKYSSTGRFFRAADVVLSPALRVGAAHVRRQIAAAHARRKSSRPETCRACLRRSGARRRSSSRAGCRWCCRARPCRRSAGRSSPLVPPGCMNRNAPSSCAFDQKTSYSGSDRFFRAGPAGGNAAALEAKALDAVLERLRREIGELQRHRGHADEAVRILRHDRGRAFVLRLDDVAGEPAIRARAYHHAPCCVSMRDVDAILIHRARCRAGPMIPSPVVCACRSNGVPFTTLATAAMLRCACASITLIRLRPMNTSRRFGAAPCAACASASYVKRPATLMPAAAAAMALTKSLRLRITFSSSGAP